MRVVNLRLDESVIEKIDGISSRLLISRSEVIRQALTLYLSLIENIGFYFKPSIFQPELEIYEERNSLSVDLGNNLSLTVFSIAYGGIGELESDWLRAKIPRVAEIMAHQVKVESLCRFTQPLAIQVSTGNNLDYSLRFYREFSKRLDSRVVLAESENIAETKQSFFSATVIGVRDMKIKNVPRRGDRIFLYGKVASGRRILDEELPDLSEIKRLVDEVRDGKISSIFPVKGDGVHNTCLYAASIAGGRLRVKERVDGGCPATAIIVTSREKPLEDCLEIGEIL